jgi:hypothetical protein
MAAKTVLLRDRFLGNSQLGPTALGSWRRRANENRCRRETRFLILHDRPLYVHRASSRIARSVNSRRRSRSFERRTPRTRGKFSFCIDPRVFFVFPAPPNARSDRSRRCARWEAVKACPKWSSSCTCISLIQGLCRARDPRARRHHRAKRFSEARTRLRSLSCHARPRARWKRKRNSTHLQVLSRGVSEARGSTVFTRSCRTPRASRRGTRENRFARAREVCRIDGEWIVWMASSRVFYCFLLSSDRRSSLVASSDSRR